MDTRFDACAAQGMTADELIDFLESRGKFREEAGGWRVNEGEICDG
jgi:probable metal-binding protein